MKPGLLLDFGGRDDERHFLLVSKINKIKYIADRRTQTPRQ